ncbi:MAG: helix-turn-helix transcriptional regulator [Oscillospiraceae bacterium]|nr:helix-turn-helix transcriptional regulator [Oscillospiraceae bacterium]
MANIAKNIRLLRRKQNMTQDQLAERLHVTRQTVSNYETGKSQPDIDTIVRLAEALQADPNTLIYGIPTPPNRKREYIHMAIAAAIALVLVIISVATRNVFFESVRKDIFRNDYTLPATWLALGYALMQLLSLVTELKPVKCIAAKVTVLLMIAVYLYLTRVVWIGGFGGLLALSVIPKIVKVPFVFLLPGAALWMFRMKKVK